METPLEIRHLRYFVAVAEAGSLTIAAKQRLFTAQPSLSRQIRDLEEEVGVPLMLRKPRGIQLTPAGAVFLDHARIALLQIEAAVVAARRAAQPGKLQFGVGFLTGYEIEWLSALMAILRDDLPSIEVTIHSQNSPELIDGLLRGQIQVAFVRPAETPGLAFHLLKEEPLIVLMPSDHALATRDRIGPLDFDGQTIVGPPATAAPVLRALIDRYASQSGIDLAPDFEAANPSMVFSLVTSTGSLAVLPLYARRLAPASVVSRPLEGVAPTIGLALAYNTANRSPVLAGLLAKIDDLKFRANSPTVD